MKLRHLIYLTFHLFHVSPCDESAAPENRKFVKSYTHCAGENRSCTVVEFTFICGHTTVEECRVQPRHIYQSPLQVHAESTSDHVATSREEDAPQEVIALVWFATLFSKVDPSQIVMPNGVSPPSIPQSILTPPQYTPVVRLSEGLSVVPANVQSPNHAINHTQELLEQSSQVVSSEKDASEDAQLDVAASNSTDAAPPLASPIALLPQMLDPIPVLGPFLSAVLGPSVESILNQPHDGSETVWERLVSNVFPRDKRSPESSDPTASPDIPFHSGGALPPREGPPLVSRKLSERSYVPLAGALEEDPWLSQALESKAVEYFLSAFRAPLTAAALTLAPHEEVQQVYEETQRRQEAKKADPSRSENALLRVIEMFSPLKGRIAQPEMPLPKLGSVWPNVDVDVLGLGPRNHEESARVLLADPTDASLIAPSLASPLAVPMAAPLAAPLLPLQGGLPFMETMAQLQPNVLAPQLSSGSDARGDRVNPTTTDMLPWIPLDSLAGEFPVWLGEALVGPFALLFEDLVRVAQDAFIRLQVIIDAVGSEPLPVASENLQTFLERMSEAFRTSLAGNEADALKSLAVTIQELPVLSDLTKDKVVTPEGTSVSQVLTQFDALIENMKHRSLIAGQERELEDYEDHFSETSSAPDSDFSITSSHFLGTEGLKYLAASAGGNNQPTTSDLLPWKPLDAIVGEYPKYLKDRGSELIESITDTFKEGGSQIAHMLFPFLPGNKEGTPAIASSSSAHSRVEKVYPQQPNDSSLLDRTNTNEPRSAQWASRNERASRQGERHEFVDDDDARNIQWVSNDGHADKSKDVQDKVADALSGAFELWPGLLKQFLSVETDESRGGEAKSQATSSTDGTRSKLFHTLDAQKILIEEAEKGKLSGNYQTNTPKQAEASDSDRTTDLTEADKVIVEPEVMTDLTPSSVECSVCKMTVEVPCDRMSSFRETLQGFLNEAQRSATSRKPEQADSVTSSPPLSSTDSPVWSPFAVTPASANPMANLLRLMPPSYLPTIDAWLDDTRKTLARHAAEIEVPAFLDPWLSEENPALSLIDLVGQIAAARSADSVDPLVAIQEAQRWQRQAYNDWLTRTSPTILPPPREIINELGSPSLVSLQNPLQTAIPPADALLSSLLTAVMQLPQPPTLTLPDNNLDPLSVIQSLDVYSHELDQYWTDLGKALEILSAPLITADVPRSPTPSADSITPLGYALPAVPPLVASDLVSQLVPIEDASVFALPVADDGLVVSTPYAPNLVSAKYTSTPGTPLRSPLVDHQPPFFAEDDPELEEVGENTYDEPDRNQALSSAFNVETIKDIILGSLEELNKIGSNEYSKAMAKLREANKNERTVPNQETRLSTILDNTGKESGESASVSEQSDAPTGDFSSQGGDTQRRLFGDRVVVTTDHNVVQFINGDSENAVKHLEGLLSSVLDTFGVPSPFSRLASDPRELLNPLRDGGRESERSSPSSDELKQRAQQGASNIIQGLADTLLSDGPRLPTVSPAEAADYNGIQYGRGHAGVESLNQVPARVPNPPATSHQERHTHHSEPNEQLPRYGRSEYNRGAQNEPTSRYGRPTIQRVWYHP